MNELLLTILKLATTTSSFIAADVSEISIRDTRNTTISVENEDITADTLLSYSKIEQELAIARRTLVSETVEIEEYYGNSLKGDVGAKLSATNIGLAASAEKGKVTKRIIKFTGFNSETESMLNAMEASLLSKLKAELSAKKDSEVSGSSIIVKE
ncbi:hypothetical protein [Citrobacter freundii]|uniref:hypothetical protein n=1 Tax=Citrobacter freundii TaxID=546 RepID=UPI000FD8F6C6|nr:hypothetical protein [Citrobacter freundii]ELK6104093.1 hypothetical protein [Citrobacter freundii]MDT7293295.1 hypothetical protein [Citrobacter freundii]MDT7417189.1 hypothetical protein [Citrobacter freundii]RVR93805.1 hypothetical protein EOL15_29400 [Citrobacter freundii]